MAAILYIIFLVLPLSIISKRYFTIEIESANLTILDPVLLTSYHYNIYNRKVIYVDFISSRDIHEFDIGLSVDVMRKDNRHTSVMNVTLPGCKALENALKANLLKILAHEVFRVSNIPRKCPILKDKLYVFKNFTIKDDDFPIITPIVEWRLLADFIIDQKPFCKGIVNGRVRKL